MKRSWMCLMSVVAMGAALCAPAQDMNAVKKSMLDRKAAVERVLGSKAVGENNTGFLQAVGKVADADAAVVAAENADRKAVYAAIAAKNGTAVAVVGQQRAAAIAAIARTGTMLQGKDGAWAEKK